METLYRHSDFISIEAKLLRSPWLHLRINYPVCKLQIFQLYSISNCLLNAVLLSKLEDLVTTENESSVHKDTVQWFACYLYWTNWSRKAKRHKLSGRKKIQKTKVFHLFWPSWAQHITGPGDKSPTGSPVSLGLKRQSLSARPIVSSGSPPEDSTLLFHLLPYENAWAYPFDKNNWWCLSP